MTSFRSIAIDRGLVQTIVSVLWRNAFTRERLTASKTAVGYLSSLIV